MDIDALAVDFGPAIYYDDGFRNTLESHLEYLRNHANTRKFILEPHIVHRYEFDFFGLCAASRIEDHFHWLVMRMNNLHVPTNFPSDISEILVPDPSVVEQIRQVYMSTRRL